MNVVSSYGINSLGIIYDRGLIVLTMIGASCSQHTLEHTTFFCILMAYLLLKAMVHLLNRNAGYRCEMKYVLLEMDRILRPSGHAIIRETSFFVDAISTIAKDLKWSCEKQETEQNGKEKL
ncbi:hypothetical protein HPP92_013978 [Vanilla planifolia]|uniref:Methyltransferase n=1 Tax=Vanilla planifolia TaxID=51239 RepID=A0A835UUC0_VANPL|nr:hypothetical protein HPP92_013978 [Vanilla planifolia]